MKLKYLILPLIISASMGTSYANVTLEELPATTAQADGIVTITGKVVAQTCEVDSQDKALSVVLPTVTAKSLYASGVVGGETPFVIHIKNCGTPNEENGLSTLPTIGVYFSAINVDNVTGTLNNIAADPAENVNVQLLNKDMTVIDLRKDAQNQITYTQELKKADNGALDFNFGARYYATGQSTPGDVLATVPFVITYQ